MHIILGILCAYVFFPVLGEALLFFSGGTIVAGEVTQSLIISNLTYALIVVILFLLVSQKRIVFSELTPFKYDLVLMRRLVIAMVIVASLVFLISGYKFLFLSAHRGELRISMGWYGPFYAWMIRFLCPVFLLMATLIFVLSQDKRRLKIYYRLMWGLVLFTAVCTGYKSVIVMSILPALSVLLYNRGFLRLGLTVAPVLVLLLVLTTGVVRGIGFIEAYHFLIYRLTSMTAFGTVGVWEHFSGGARFSEVIKLSYGMFGNNIAVALLGHERDTVEFLSTNLSRLITYLVYPNKEGALAGTVNVTVTNFGEAVYMFGHYFWIHAIFAGTITGLVIRRFKYHLIRGKYVASSLWLLYFFTIILPWFNSSNIFILISLPTLVWLIMTWVILHLIMGHFRLR